MGGQGVRSQETVEVRFQKRLKGRAGQRVQKGVREGLEKRLGCRSGSQEQRRRGHRWVGVGRKGS